jgi:hypothetical protein
MANIKARFFLTLLVLVAFFGPFIAVVAVENAKRESRLLSDQSIIASAKKDAEAARYQYYLGVTQQRDNLKQSMADAKAQYEQLLKDQPQKVQDNQKTVTQTTIQPIVVQKVVTQPVTTTTTTASKPTSSAKTKTS